MILCVSLVRLFTVSVNVVMRYDFCFEVLFINFIFKNLIHLTVSALPFTLHLNQDLVDILKIWML
jgi:hypothetical protein